MASYVVEIGGKVEDLNSEALDTPQRRWKSSASSQPGTGRSLSMAKKVRPTPAPTETPKPLWSRPWVIFAAAVTSLATVLTGVGTILAQSRSLPSEWQKTYDQVTSWYYEDSQWTGRWSNNPEAYVDEADMDLSKDPIELEIVVKNGLIDGTIATKGICDRTPFAQFLLLRGDVSWGGTANVEVWDVIGGHQVDFGVLKLERDGETMEVIFEEGAKDLFLARAKIARASKQATSDRSEFCAGKTARITKVLEEVAREIRASEAAKANAVHKGTASRQ